MKQFKHTPNKSYNIDGKIIWNSRSVALVGIVILCKDGEVYTLTIKRGTGGEFAGLHCIPCGYLDYSETCEEAVVREIYEESGVDILDLIDEKNNNYVMLEYLNTPWYISSNPQENHQNVTINYLTIIDIGSDQLPVLTDKYSEPNEIENVMWLKVKDVDKVEWAFHHDLLIKKALKLPIS